MLKNNSVTIIGSGLAGSFLAVLLSQRGFNVDIYEKLTAQEISSAASKRSYNLTLYGYALTILKKSGIWNELEPHLIPLKGSVTHIANETKPVVLNLNAKKISHYAVSRARLAHILLKKAAQSPNVSMHYQSNLLSINRYDKTMVIEDTKTNTLRSVKTDVVIGADGANSLVRIFIQQGQDTSHVQEVAPWNYRQFVLSNTMVDKLNLLHNYVQIWTQKNTFIILHPNFDNGLSALFVFPHNKSSVMNNTEKIQDFITENFPDLIPAINEITATIPNNPDGYFATIHTDPWYYKDFITLIGDAAHGFNPFFGQGATAAFGDCIALCKLLDTYGTNWEKIFSNYQELRKRHTDALGELSKEALNNYLRYKKADYAAIYDKLEMIAYRLFPKFISPPPFHSVISDPDHADDHRLQYLKQRKIAKYFGVPFSVHVVTGIISLYDDVHKRFTKSVK